MGRCTDRMKSFATDIADELGLDYPDWDDFDAVSEFIDENKDDYYESRRLFH